MGPLDLSPMVAYFLLWIAQQALVRALLWCAGGGAGRRPPEARVQPRASRTGIAGLHGDAIGIRVAAPPVDGAANDALVRFLANQIRRLPGSGDGDRRPDLPHQGGARPRHHP